MGPPNKLASPSQFHTALIDQWEAKHYGHELFGIFPETEAHPPQQAIVVLQTWSNDAPCSSAVVAVGMEHP